MHAKGTLTASEMITTKSEILLKIKKVDIRLHLTLITPDQDV